MRNLGDGVIALLVISFMVVLAVMKLDHGRRMHLPTDWKQAILHDANTNVTDANDNVDVHNVFPENCGCQSMFTVGGCGMKQVINVQEDPFQASALSGLSAARLKGTQMFKFMEILTRYFPQLFKAELENNINGDLVANLNEHPSRAIPSLPFVPCQMHIYTTSDINTCTKLFKRKWNVPMRIAFIGDSRNRNTMQEMLRILIKEFKLTIDGEEIHHPLSNFIANKAKFTVYVQGENIELNFIWAPILDGKSDEPILGYDDMGYGARDIFELWSEGRSWTNTKTNQKFHVPHLVVVNTGMWHSNGRTQTDEALSDMIHTMHIMSPLLKKLSMRTRVLWPLSGPIKEHLAFSAVDVATPALDLMNSVTWLKLKASQIWLWDTRTIMMIRQKQECFELYEAGFKKNLPFDWGCWDFQHAGRDVERGAINMIWNLVCNSLLDLKDVYCCS